MSRWLPVRALGPKISDRRDCLKVCVYVKDSKIPCLRRTSNKKVDHRRTVLFSDVDEFILSVLDESPHTVGHRVPSEQSVQSAPKLITVRFACDCSNELRLHGRTYTDQTSMQGINPTRRECLATAQPDDHRCVGQVRHAA
jgi:hypothetical protein